MSLVEELERLKSLHDRDAISAEEYARAKAQVLAQGGTPDSGLHRSLLHQMARSRADHIIGGVCGGLGAHTDLPAWAWRLIFCLSLLYFGAGLVIYLLLWLLLPLRDP
jgi:phage shock protein C